MLAVRLDESVQIQDHLPLAAVRDLPVILGYLQRIRCSP